MSINLIQSAKLSIIKKFYGHQKEVLNYLILKSYKKYSGRAVDLIPDTEKGVLNVCLYHMANPQTNKAVKHLLEYFYASDLCFPGTKLKLAYSLGKFE